jgi:small-conductance mechanosensitive channel
MSFFDRVSEALGLSPEAFGRIAGTVAVILVWLLIRHIARRLIARSVEESASRYQMTRVTGYAIGAVAFLAIARLWIQGIAGIATYFGLLSAGVAIALQDPLANLVGWLYIIIRRPFKVGDRVQVGQHVGDVVDLRPFRILMLEVGNWVHADQGTGRILHVPNGLVFKNTVANYDEAFGYIWNELEVTVTFESDWRKAKKALESILEGQAEKIDAHVRERIDEAAHTLHIRFPKLTPVVWTKVVDSGVCLTMRYLCKPRQRRSSETTVWEQVLDAFAEFTDVDFAYPTARRFDNITEGKPEARATPSRPSPSSKIPGNVSSES